MIPDDDVRDLRAAQAGNVEAFESLVRRHYNACVRMAAKRAGRMDAEDIALDALLEFHKHLGQFSPHAPIRATLRRLIDRQSLLRTRPTTASVLRPVVPLSPDRPDVRTADRELRGLLEKEIQRLPEPERTLFIAHDIQLRSFRQIANGTAMSLSGVREKVAKARQALREKVLREVGRADWHILLAGVDPSETGVFHHHVVPAEDFS